MRHVSRTHRVALDWLFDGINLDPKIQIKYIDTKNQLADILTKGHFTRDEWNDFLCLFNISHFSSINSVKAMSRCRVRGPTVLASTASENPVNTKSEGQKVPLSPLNVQLTGTVKPVLLASSSNSSEWNNDDKWSSQGRKSGEMSNTSTVRPVSNKVVIDIDMDSDTATESDLSPKSRSLLNRVNDRLRKMLNRSPEDLMQDIDKRSLIWWMFMSSTLEASVFMGKELLRQFTFHQKHRWKSQFKEDVRDIWTVDIGTIRWDFWSVSNQLGKISMETVISGQWWRSHQSLACKGLRILRFCVLSWKDESEPNIKYCLGATVGMVQRFITIQNIGHNRRRTDGIRVEYFPRILNIGACPRSPKVHEQNGRTQRNCKDELSSFRCSLTSYGELQTMNKNVRLIPHLCLYSQKDFQQSFLGPGSEIKWYSTDKERPGGKWDRVAELMMIKFGESGHPVFRATSPLSRGTLKSKGGGKLSRHFCADGKTMETVFRTIISVNQLSIYGAVSELCEENNICQTSTRRPVVAWQSNPTHFSRQQTYW